MPPCAQTRRDKRLWLIPVAVGCYADASMNLPGVPKDANRLPEALGQQRATLADIIPLFNENATRERILDTIADVARRALFDEQVLFWFGGHGHEKMGGDSPMPDGMTRYLLPHEATWDTVETHGISMKQLAGALRQLRAAEVVVILDCCHSGGLSLVFAGQLRDLLQEDRRRYVLAAARHIQLAMDTDDGSPLTQNFCDALEGNVPTAVSADGRVSAIAAGHHAQECVESAAKYYHHQQKAVAFQIGSSPIYLTRITSINPTTGVVWRPRVCYPLQPALHFHGRGQLREDLLKWMRSRAAGVRVWSLVAMGGTGKTALAERVLSELGEQAPAGVLVWSFYENPRTEDFLRTACEYFTGEMPTSAGGLLERLQTALMSDELHLLVLDGLERVQAEGTTGRLRGEIEDPQLRRLLRWLAAGQGTKTRALVTSRFPLVDLNDWKNGGHRETRLEDLEPGAARAVMKGWGVRGDEATLDGLVVPLHHHALSVDVLGSYLGKLWGGDPTRAPTFDRDEEAAVDPKAARLNRILTSYAEKLPNAERDLLARLSTFPRGVTVEFLGFLVEAGGQIAGALVDSNEVKLRRLLEELRGLGLVFSYGSSQGITFTAHPFLREYFRDLLGVTKPTEIHEVVRARLAPSLEARPDKKPTDPAMLDRYEALIEHTRLAGWISRAFDLYADGLGGYANLCWVVGENVRGLRIVSGFSPDGSPEKAGADLPVSERGSLLYAWGWFAENLGDLASARRAFSVARDNFFPLPTSLRAQADVELLAGRLPTAGRIAVAALMEADKVADPSEVWSSHAYLGCALARMGQLGEARHHFSNATKLQQGDPPLNSLWEAEFKRATGDRRGAAAQTEAIQIIAVQNQWNDEQALCETLLGLLSLPEETAEARQHLDAARAFASRSGHVEVQLCCYHLAAEIARTEGVFDTARSEAEAGIHQADTCGFGHCAIELRLALARVQLNAGNPRAALQPAREALERSVHTKCQYAWGEADALHLCGVAHARLGERDLARQRLTAALARRQQLTHPGVTETQAEFARLGG